MTSYLHPRETHTGPTPGVARAWPGPALKGSGHVFVPLSQHPQLCAGTVTVPQTISEVNGTLSEPGRTTADTELRGISREVDMFWGQFMWGVPS